MFNILLSMIVNIYVQHKRNQGKILSTRRIEILLLPTPPAAAMLEGGLEAAVKIVGRVKPALARDTGALNTLGVLQGGSGYSPRVAGPLKPGPVRRIRPCQGLVRQLAGEVLW